MKFSTGVLHNKKSGKHQFHVNLFSNSLTLLKRLNAFQPVLSIVLGQFW